jgi:hypothetical protein
LTGMGIEEESKGHNSEANGLIPSSILISIRPILSEGKAEDSSFDLEELEINTRRLRDELSDADAIERIDLVTKKREAPKGAKPGGELVEWGSLIITLATTVAPSLSNLLQSWLTRHDKQKIVLEIGGDKLEVTGISDIERSKLIDAWIISKLERRGK